MSIEKEIKQSKFRNDLHRLDVNFIYTSNWLYAFQASFLKPFKITSQQYNVLRILRGQHPNPASVKLVRERMLDKMSDASRIVEKLRRKNLAERKISIDDRRVCDVLITDKGLKLLSKIDSVMPEFDKIFSAHQLIREANGIRNGMSDLAKTLYWRCISFMIPFSEVFSRQPRTLAS